MTTKTKKAPEPAAAQEAAPATDPTPEPVPGFAEHLAYAVEAVIALLGYPNVPDPISVAVTEDVISIVPWEPGAPLTALLAWAKHLDPPLRWEAIVLSPPTPDEPMTVSVVATGSFVGHTVELVAATYRDVGVVQSLLNVSQRVDEADVVRVAAQECPIGDLA